MHRKWHGNGKHAEKTNYKNGEIEGLDRSWYRNSQLQKETNHKNGKREGLHRSWYKNGQLKEQTNHKNGKREGLHRSWHENGKLWKETNYKNGEIEGRDRKLRDNGGIYQNNIYINNERYSIDYGETSFLNIRTIDFSKGFELLYPENIVLLIIILKDLKLNKINNGIQIFRFNKDSYFITDTVGGPIISSRKYSFQNLISRHKYKTITLPIRIKLIGVNTTTFQQNNGYYEIIHQRQK